MPIIHKDGTVYHQASPGAGVVFYRLHPDKANTLLVGCGKRSAKVGAGYGISAGGFADCDKLYTKPPGTVVDLRVEAYRELLEEIPGSENVFPTARHFTHRVQPLVQFVVRTKGESSMHCPCYYACAIQAHEQWLLSILGVSDETEESLQFFELNWSRDGSIASFNCPPLYHAHEMLAFEELAFLASTNMLWL
jgi:hypothetical protein